MENNEEAEIFYPKHGPAAECAGAIGGAVRILRAARMLKDAPWKQSCSEIAQTAATREGARLVADELANAAGSPAAQEIFEKSYMEWAAKRFPAAAKQPEAVRRQALAALCGGDGLPFDSAEEADKTVRATGKSIVPYRLLEILGGADGVEAEFLRRFGDRVKVSVLLESHAPHTNWNSTNSVGFCSVHAAMPTVLVESAD